MIVENIINAVLKRSKKIVIYKKYIKNKKYIYLSQAKAFVYAFKKVYLYKSETKKVYLHFVGLLQVQEMTKCIVSIGNT